MFDRPTKEQKKELAKWMKRYPTPAESMLWFQIKKGRIGGANFGRQVRFCGYILDFACHEHRLCIEVDGGVHNARKDYDDKRDFTLFQQGWRTLRFKNEEVFKAMPWVISRISEVLRVADVGVRQPTAKMQRRTADRIAGRTKYAQRRRFDVMCKQVRESRTFDPTPRLKKPEAISAKASD